ncbi:hypothetical protein LguiB_021596 [Lonicera macranthoides]
MAEPRAKCPRFSRGEDDYLPGNIVEIEIHNFMTFNNLKCKPGSRLNLVIGPNGSGKSSLVCAIALGLGGEPQLLGRASTVGAYVKRGEESGYIKISLRGDTKAEQINIMRKIDTRNKSEWLFNVQWPICQKPQHVLVLTLTVSLPLIIRVVLGQHKVRAPEFEFGYSFVEGKVVPKREIIEVIQRFNIQVNNLTQFLPQDRVCEFAKLTPVQLLEETEKAVGDPQLPVQHHALVDKSDELKKFELTVQKNRESLDQLKALNAEQERDVERVRQRGELLAKVESMKKKLPWLKYDMKKAKYVEAKEQENDAKKKLDEAAKIVNELRQPIEKQKQEKAAQDAKYKKVRGLLDGNCKKWLQLMDNESHLSVQVRGKFNEMEEFRRQEQSHQEKISRAKEDVAAAELELANLPPYDPPRDELERLRAQILELEAAAGEKMSLKAEKEKLLVHNKGKLGQCIDRLREMENTNYKRLHALRDSGAEKIFEAYRWVREHRRDFKKDVYGPVLVEVNVSNRVHADYLEGRVPEYIWKAFITQHPEDRDVLFRNLRSFDVVVINHVNDHEHHKEPFRVSEEMRALGIYSRLDQVFDAPHAVKEVLTGQFGLESSYIGSKETDAKADEVQRLGILDFWTPENHYRWSKSRYGSHISGNVEAVEHSHLLLCNVDVSEIERLRLKKKELEETLTVLDGSLKSLHSELKFLEDEAAQLQREREDIINIVQHEKRKRREMEHRVNQRKLKLKNMEREEDLDAVIAKLVDAAGNLNIQRFQSAMEIKAANDTLHWVWRRVQLLSTMSCLSSLNSHLNLVVSKALKRRVTEERKMLEIQMAIQVAKAVQSAKMLHPPPMPAKGYHLRLARKRVAFRSSVAEKNMASIELETKRLVIWHLLFSTFPLDCYVTHQRCKKEADDLRRQLLFAKRHAESVAMITPEVEQAFLKMPGTIEELEAAIQDTISQANSILFLNHNILEEYDRRQKKIEVLAKKQESDEVELTSRLEEINSLKESWLPKLRNLVAQINETFSRNFQEMAVAGEVSLDEHDMDFDKYGILIKVKFRQTGQLQVLSAHHQSGGERSVSTILYLVSLQELTNCPFRVVDEINQGMDPINERKMCFLLTPKLLSDLEYSEACSILTIMNGPWIDQPSKGPLALHSTLLTLLCGVAENAGVAAHDNQLKLTATDRLKL